MTVTGVTPAAYVGVLIEGSLKGHYRRYLANCWYKMLNGEEIYIDDTSCNGGGYKELERQYQEYLTLERSNTCQ